MRVIGSAYIGAYTYHTCESDDYDAIGDVRYYGDNGRLIVEKCTVANGVKGGGTWAALTPFVKSFNSLPGVDDVNIGDVFTRISDMKKFELIDDDGKRYWVETTSPTFENPGDPRKPILNILDWNADPTNTVECAGNIQSAVWYAEGLPFGATIVMPEGKYRVSSTIRVKKSYVGFQGDGKYNTEIYHFGDYGDTFYVAADNPITTRLSDITFRDFKITTSSTAMSSGAHIHISDAINILITDVILWNGFIGMKFQGIQVAHINSTTIKSGSYFTEGVLTGSRFVEILPAQNPANKVSEVFFTDFNWSRTGYDAIEYGLYITQADGIWFSNGHIFGAETLCRLEPATTSTQLAGVMFDQVWFDNYTISKIGVHFTKTGCTNFQNIVFNNCRSDGCLENSFVIDTGDARPYRVSVNGGIWGNNEFETFKIDGGWNISLQPEYIITGGNTAATSKGVYFTSNLSRSIFIKTIFDGSSGTPLPIGIDVGNTTIPFLISDCVYEYCTTHINLTDHARSGGRIGLGTNVGGVTYADVAAANDMVIPTTAEIITLTGGATTINTIGYGWDGRRITLRPIDANQTIAHNVGSTAGKILTNSGANITLTQYRALTLTYSARAGAWLQSI